ncbi:hypothetical protein EC973_002526 [Apophysomyces ossiformis]|uniref:Uncharacterized protein n=1 Tax=Apophysomyces ossiformis TaxID=679940 RepID=A0A8H7BY74_9FUNG|nr:hypothetical protein EC973_002526 [Apophysomyces ossiformis]
MKLTSPFASLSVAAALLLQSGTFVQASPFFNHANDISVDTTCQDVRITYPATEGLVFEDATKHVIAWQLPASTFQQVNITLVGQDNNNNTNVAYVGTYAADRGASDEVPLSLNGQQPGDYHFHLATVGGTSACQIDSVKFRIEKPKIETPVTQPTPTVTTTVVPTGTLTATTTTVATTITPSPALDGTATTANNTTTTPDTSSNPLEVDDTTLDQLIESIRQSGNSSNDSSKPPSTSSSSSSSSSASASDNHINDSDLEKILDEIKADGASTSSHNDKKPDDEEVKHDKQQHDKAWDAMLDQVDEYLKPHRPKTNDKDHLNEVVNEMFEALERNTKTHKNEAPNTDKPAVTATPSTGSDQKLESFDELIRSFDQDYTKYLESNKQSESEKVTHKNDAPHDNDYFTNEDHRTPGHANEIPGLDEALQQLHDNEVKTQYFTNEDHRTTTTGHSNTIPGLDEALQQLHDNAAGTASQYFTNEDHRTGAGHVNQIPGLEESLQALHDNEVKAQYFTNEDRRSNHLRARAIPLFDTTYFTNEDHRTNAHQNEWQSEDDAYFTDEDRTTPHENAWVEEDGTDQANEADEADEAAEEYDATPDWSHQDAADEWTVEEVAPAATWADSQEGLPDHSNDGQWVSEEYDPLAPKVTIEEPEEHPNDGTITDHTNEGTFSTEEVEAVAEPSHDDFVPTGVWQEDDAESQAHFNDADWQTEEASAEEGANPQSTAGDSEWIVEEEAEEQPPSSEAHLNEWVEDFSETDAPSGSAEWHQDEVAVGEVWHDANDGTSAADTEDHTNAASDWQEDYTDNSVWHADEVPVTEDRAWQDKNAAAAFENHQNEGEWIAEESFLQEDAHEDDGEWHEV